MNRRLLPIAVLSLLARPLPADTGEIAAFDGPEVTKLDWNIRALRAADINGDGRQDLVLLNNDRSTIVVLIQNEPGAAAAPERSLHHNRWEPVVEDARFRKESMTAGITLYDLATGDLNGDGRVDLVYTGAPHALTIRYRTEDDDWREQRITPAPDPAQFGPALAVQDLDGDGRDDLVMLGQTELAVYRQNDDGTLASPERFPLPDDNAYGLRLTDFDRDGRADITYGHGRDPRGSLRVRLQTSTGAFGPELAFPLERLVSAVTPVQALNSEGDTVSAYTYVAGPVGQVQVVTFAQTSESDADRLPRPRMFRPRQSGRTPTAYAIGDYNGDGRSDVAASDADGAQVSIYFRQADGGFTEARTYPSLSEARALAAVDWDGDGRDELFLSSVKERIVARAVIDADGRMEYPQPLPLEGKPVALAAHASPEGALLAVVYEDSGAHHVALLAGADAEPRTIALPKLRTDPSAIAWWDANQDGRADLVLFVPRDPLRIFVQDDTGAFSDASGAPGYRKGLVDGVERSSVTFADVDGDTRPEMVIAARGFARALRLSTDGALEVVTQFNARTATAEIATTLHLRRAGSGGSHEVVLYDRRAEEFTLLRPGAQGGDEVAKTQVADRIEVVGSWSGESECFIFGADRFWWLPLEHGEFEQKPLAPHVTDLPGVRYGYVVPVDFDGDGIHELIAVDPERHVVEMLAPRAEPTGWRSWLHFVVFEVDPHQPQGNRASFEPREACVADVTGDGREDLVLLVHDRVLVYPRK